MTNQTKTNWNSPDYFRILDEANNSTAGSILANQSFQYQVDRNDSAKPGFETGSNFMLLLEDFGEYFYNYNGSGGTIVGNNNSIGFEFQTNCSITNSTCVTEGSTGKHYNL